MSIGAMVSLLPKLAELVAGEYKLHKDVKGKIEKLEKELKSITVFLRAVAEMPPDQLHEQTKIWAGDVRELSYDIEDKVDTFMLHNNEHKHTEPGFLNRLKELFDDVTHILKRAKNNHKINKDFKEIMDRVEEVKKRHDRYKIDDLATKPDTSDPRLDAMYRMATELVGIDRPKKELKLRLEQDCSSSWTQKSNIISIVGFGGLGKTTLANSLLQDLKSKFDSVLLVSVSLNPDIKKTFKTILHKLDEKKYSNFGEGWDDKLLLIDEIRKFLKNKRCLCVIDDLWKESDWDDIKYALEDGHPGGKVIITTRNRSVAQHVSGGIYDMKPLSEDDSRKLLNKRVFRTDDECPLSLREVSGKIIKKCGGVPLAIITIASLLANKTEVEWEEVNKSIGSGLENNLAVDKMMKILSLSYNELPFYLKTCLLSLSKYPEDRLIRKDVLVWSWIAEGFIKQDETRRHAGKSLQEIAESYFNDLINRSLIQPAKSRAPSDQDGQVHCCQVHDMVLELLKQLSDEEGFVTVFSEDGQQESTLTSAMQNRKIRRLSLHNNSTKSYGASPEAVKEQLSKVRSLDIFGMVKSVPPLSSFPLLRVLQVDDCSGLDDHHVNDLGKLRLLRFLRLHGLDVTKLPESISELESLETLDIRDAKSVILLPVSFYKLGKLVRLHASRVKVPDGLTLENMKALQELVGIWPTLHAVTEIGKLGELKVLGLRFTAGITNANDLIVRCLRLHPNLQVFILTTRSSHSYPMDMMIEHPVDLMAQFPSGLQTFITTGYFYRAFPKWIKRQLSYLTKLHLNLSNVRVLPEHLEQLADLPSLRFLKIYTAFQPDEQEMLSSVSGFSCLTDLELHCPLLFLKFQGAMPKLQNLQVTFSPGATNNKFLRTNSFDYGFENFPRLCHLVIRFVDDGTEAGDAIRMAFNDHPNHPTLDFSYNH